MSAAGAEWVQVRASGTCSALTWSLGFAADCGHRAMFAAGLSAFAFAFAFAFCLSHESLKDPPSQEPLDGEKAGIVMVPPLV